MAKDNYKSIYQDLKFFDKNGYEIPLIIASNIVIKVYNKNGNEGDATILNGVFTKEKDIDGNFIINDIKILNVGKSFNSEKINLENSIVDVYIDGICLKKCKIDFKVKECASFNIAYTSSNAVISEYTNYGIKEFDYFECIISKKELDDLFGKDYELPYPSLIFNADINMEKVSTGLHSVETIYFGIEKEGKLIKPYDEKYNIVFITDAKDDDIQFFIVDKNSEEIYKRHIIEIQLDDENTLDDEYFDITSEDFDNVINIDDILTSNPQLNVCFSSKEEGVHEQKIYVMLKNRENDKEIIKIGEFNVIVEAEGEDERFRSLFANFGIPDPIMYPTLFKECDIKEEKTNWEIVNRKSKELFLTYDEIFPYVGTYKALINAIKFLGYDDVYFREWYKDIKKGIKYSKRLNINENFKDYDPYLTYDNVLENRISQKKLNKLTLVYKINEETSEIDEYNIPILKNVYNYSVDEVLIKINSLKEWLERNILALNCRIIEITGEGVVYEKQGYKTYGTIMQNLDYEEYLNFTPYVKNKIEELKDSSANIKVSILNNSETSHLTFEDFFDETIAEYEKSYNGTIAYPFVNDLYVKAFVDCDSAIINENVDNGLFIEDNKILLLKNKQDNLIDSKFIIAPIIQLEDANIRLCSNVNQQTYKDWWSNIKYTISNKNDETYSYIITDKEKDTSKQSNDYIILMPIENKAEFKYFYKEDIDSPVFSFKGYQLCLYNNNKSVFDTTFINIDEEFILEINKGKIINKESKDVTSYIVFDYLEDKLEQSIKVTYQYEGLYMVDKRNINDDIAIYEPYYNVKVNKTGHYKIMTYAMNSYGNLFAKELLGGCDVIIETPMITSYHKDKNIINDGVFYKENSISAKKENIKSDKLPKFKWKSHIYEMSLDKSENKIVYPNLSYNYHMSMYNDYVNFSNINDRFKCITKNGNIYTFKSLNLVMSNINEGDYVNIVIYDKNYLNGIYEIEGCVYDIDKEKNEYTILLFESISDEYMINNRYEIYIFSTTEGVVEEISIDSNDDKCSIIALNGKKMIYNVNDVIKIIYKVGGDYIVDNCLYYSYDNVNFYKVLVKNGNEYVPILLDNNGVMRILEEEGETEDDLLTNIYFSSASFRIKGINYDSVEEKTYIMLDGIFNYKKYDELYNKETEKITTELHISKANQKYVNYVMRAITSNENKNDDIILFTKRDRLYDFIDDNYSFVITSFDKNNAFENWTYIENEKMYEHLLPLTIKKNENIVYNVSLLNNDIKLIRWRIYKRNKDNQTRELLFEVENEMLSLNLKNKGIYDIEVYIYDKYGNVSYKDFQSILCVK